MTIRTVASSDRSRGPRVSSLLCAGRTGLALLIAGATLAAQDRPLPDQESFLKETRKHLQTDSTRQSSYVYVETRREQKLDKQGRIREESIKVFESYPGLPGEARWERLIAENGRPLPADGTGEAGSGAPDESRRDGEAARRGRSEGARPPGA